MRRTVVILMGLAVALPAVAEAAPLGAPDRLRVARAADIGAHPSAPYEEWLVRLVDPSAQRSIGISLVRAVAYGHIRVFTEGAGETSLHDLSAYDRDAAGPPTWSTGRGFLTITTQRGGWRVAGSGALNGSIEIRGVRPGGAASTWRFGDEPTRGPRDLNWAQPVGTGLAEGTVTLDLEDGERTIELDDWWASIDHWWGRFDRESGMYRSWEVAVLHGRRGRSWSFTGANRVDLLTGPGARDALFLGVVARTGRGRTTLCRPRVDRRGWGGLRPPFPHTSLRLRCGRRAVAARVVPDSTFAYDLGLDARVTASGGRVGFLRQVP